MKMERKIKKRLNKRRRKRNRKMEDNVPNALCADKSTDKDISYHNQNGIEVWKRIYDEMLQWHRQYMTMVQGPQIIVRSNNIPKRMDQSNNQSTGVQKATMDNSVQSDISSQCSPYKPSAEPITCNGMSDDHDVDEEYIKFRVITETHRQELRVKRATDAILSDNT